MTDANVSDGSHGDASPMRGRSQLWILLGFFFGMAGGALAGRLVRGDDPELARECRRTGIIFTAVWALAILLLLTALGGFIKSDHGPHLGYHDPDIGMPLGKENLEWHPHDSHLPGQCHGVLHGMEGDCLVTREMHVGHSRSHAGGR